MDGATIAESYERKTWLDRLMGLVAEVHAGEAFSAVLLALNVFLLLAAYYIIKPVREALILASGGGGAEIKSYIGAVQAALFLLIVPAYSRFAAKANRIKLINGLFLFFTSNLILFYLLSKSTLPLGIIFFLWVGIFNVMVIAQFWSFANDVYSPEQGKRLFAIVGVGSTLGAVAGSKAASWLVKPIGVYQMMLVSAAILIVCLALTNIINNRERNKGEAGSESRKKIDAPIGGEGGFKLVFRYRYLLLIALLILIVNWVNTNGEYILGETVSNMAKRQVANGNAAGLNEKQIIGGFYADFQFWQNLIGALLQFFLVSRIFKYLGVRAALFFMPVISLTGYSMMALFPILSYIKVAKIAENSTDYSIQNTVRHALFLPTSRDAKYKAKQAVDTFFWRSGDMLSALAVFLGAHLMHLAVQRFALFNIVLVVLWITLAAAIGREYKKMTDSKKPVAAV